MLSVSWLLLLPITRADAVLSCSVTTNAGCAGTPVLRMSSGSNAHAELVTQSNAAYAGNVICCTASQTLGTSCAGNFDIVLKLASTTNSHVQQNTFSTYTNNACISIVSGGVSIGYRNSDCSGYDTMLGSMTATDNSHVGSSTAHTMKICGSEAATVTPQVLSISISDNSIGFGSLSSAAARFATGDTLGNASEIEAHNVKVMTNAAFGYTVVVQGPTLTAGAYTVTAIGGTNTTSSVGSEQFGLRAVATGGIGVVASPYTAAGFAYVGTATTTSLIASASSGDSATTTYSFRYIANISPTTETGSYASNLVYTVTANF